ncbi:MAG: glucose-6-phosphate dehydrogenase assembly protein OpcA, partial [Phycisphaerae bacterium]|nr:glucose-6-phosphate dehydrogenase assembly protein OpcA [Phycisphaerae bacterium]
IAQIFDNPKRENKLSSFHAIEIAHTDDKPCASVLYMAAWLSAPYKATVSIVKVNGHGPGLHRVRLRSDSETIDFERTGPDCMQLRSTNGRQRVYSFNEAGLYTLMNEELSVLGPDPAFDSALARAQELAIDYR